MKKKEKQLKNLNKTISKGRVKSSLRFAYALLLGLSIAQFLNGSGLVFLLFGAWISFILSFFCFYTLNWNKTLSKAHELAKELNGDVVSPPEEERGCWLVFILISVLLVSPLFFKDVITRKSTELYKNTMITLRSISDGEDKVTFAVPLSYTTKVRKTLLNIDFINQKISGDVLTAQLPDMRPHYQPITALPSSYRKKGYVAIQPSHPDANPKLNPDAIVIEIKNHAYDIDKDFIHSMLSQIRTDTTEEKHEYGLKIQSGAMQVTNAIFAYPSYENRVESHKGT
tara:strand:- start:20 stop:871 length:852 start_codon:yes stop_codon:yes gene_type:complete